MATASLELNPQQRQAVEHGSGPLLVIAGAGSGKTRVLTARVARLIESGTPAEAILAFTFTNRAAREMRERIERQVGDAARRLWAGTFHATAVRILRRDGRRLGIPEGFAIYDREDQEGVLREILKAMELPEGAYRAGTVLARISGAKNALVEPDAFARVAVSPYERRVAEIYAAYQAALRRNGALDFDDLIADTVRLMLEHPETGRRWSERFRHVLVDEYQDTNHAQFRLVHALAGGHGNLFVVGDDDQSIYGWRGADLSNVLDFEQAFPGAAVIRLEQNYRSTHTILRAANAVIAHNRARKGKTLWSEREPGAQLKFVLAADEQDEAQRIRRWLEDRVRRGARLDETAVLYRTNAQSRALETELRGAGLAYEMVGGVAFYQRREVKDVLAYLRLVVNPEDAVAFWRVWNTPRRGLGPAVRALVERRMADDGVGPVTALRALVHAHALARAAETGARQLLDILDELAGRVADPLDAVVMALLDRTGYLGTLDDEQEGGDERRANVEELVAAAGSFSAEGGAGLTAFLGETALVTDADRLAEGADRVLLLTAHNAKGLEFPSVVIAGLEEGLMPHATALEDPAELEEERRLFYVALTRAQDEVMLTAAAWRRRFDAARAGQVSRFVDEIPAELLEREVTRGTRWSHHAAPEYRGAPRTRGSYDGDEGARTWMPARREGGAFASRAHRAVGRRVRHETFGRGVVTAVEGGDGEELRYQVRFAAGTKKVLARFLSEDDDGDPA
ncbi:MAG TPA: UvrD-helicase domain-containing protein [Candidatus Eisenbacteria bacterium]|nr:UvrD-helicase domain-containing protein [Candidatus Eisenbacteria bacterium]